MAPGATACNALVPLPNKTLLAVKVAAPVPPLATGKVPVTPVVNGSPVKLVATPDAGVPNIGYVKVGDVSVLLVKVSIPAKVASVPAVSYTHLTLPTKRIV